MERAQRDIQAGVGALELVQGPAPPAPTLVAAATDRCLHFLQD